MKERRAGTGFVVAVALAVLAAVLAGPAGVSAQQGDARSTSLEQHHPYLADLVDAFDAAHGLIYQEVLAGGESGSDAPLYDRLVQDLLSTPARAGARPASRGAGEGATAPRRALPDTVVRALERANAFHRDLLEVYADPSVSATYRRVDRLIGDYLSEPGTAFLSDPKDMSIVAEGAQAGAFRETHPRLHGLMWAHRWLELAAFEPLIRYDTPERRRAGVMAVVARFWTMLENPPESFPTEMPQTPTIAPALVSLHPRAAAILDNANMFHDVAADFAVSEQVEEPASRLRTTLARFQDPEYFRSSWYDWNRMAIIHGVGNQGGWATGIIPDPRRTDVTMEHMDHFAIPGMPTENE